jgi:hypothetical protein
VTRAVSTAAAPFKARLPPWSAIICPTLAGCLLLSLAPRAVSSAELAAGAAGGSLLAIAIWRARRVLFPTALGCVALALAAFFATRQVDDRCAALAAVIGSAVVAVLGCAPVYVARRHSAASLRTGQPSRPERVAVVSAVVLAVLAQATTRIVGVEVRAHWGPGVVAFGDEQAASFAVSSACLVSAALAAWVLWRHARHGAGAGRWRAAAGLVGLTQIVLLTTTLASWIAHCAPLRGVVRVVTRGNYRCVEEADGDAACWGRNDSGELGDGTTRLRQHPVPVRDLHDVADLEPPCARLRSGEVRCWGTNGGHEDGWARLSASLPRARLLRDTCLVSIEDEVLCWYADTLWRVPVNAAGALDLWGHSRFGCVRRPDTIACWGQQGWNDRGWTSDPRRVPIVALSTCPAPTDGAAPVAGTARYLTAARNWDHAPASSAHYMEVTSAARVRAWRLPTEDDETCGQPFDVPGLAPARAVVGPSLSFPGLLLGPDGTLRRWTLQDGVAQVRAPILDHVVDIDQAGTCAVRDDGTLWCWGGNDFGEVGDGTREERENPTLVRR